MKFSKTQAGFTAVEIVIFVVILAALGGSGYYVYGKNRTTKPKTTTKTTTQTTVKLDKTDPVAVAKAFINDMNGGNKTEANSLITADFKTVSLQQAHKGEDNFYDVCKADQLCIGNFTYVDINKATVTTNDDYTATSGTKGKNVVFSEVVTPKTTNDTGSAESSKSLTIGLIKDGDNWAVDDFSEGSNANASTN